MFTNAEQFANATKALFEFQLMTFNSLASQAVQGVEQVVALNLATAKEKVEHTIAAGKEISESKDAKGALQVAAAHVQPNLDGIKVYNEELGEIIKEIHAEFTSAATAHLAEAKTNLSALIYDVTKNVPPGTENAVQIVKSAIDNAFKGYEEVNKATKQAVKDVEEKIAKATEQVAPRANGKTSAKAAKK